MPDLTRRRSHDRKEECWHVYYGDVRVGTIAIRVGVAHDEDAWGWIGGFYPGRNRASILTEGLSPSIRRALISNVHGRCFCQIAPRPTFRRGAISGIGPSGNMQCGKEARNRRLRSPAPS